MTKAIKDVFAGYDFSKVHTYYYTRQDEPRQTHYSHVEGKDLENFVHRYNERQDAKFVFTLYKIVVNGKEYSTVEITINEDHNNSFWASSTAFNNYFTDAAKKAVEQSPSLNAFIKSLDFDTIKQNRLEEILNRYKNEATARIIAAQSVLDYLNN